MPGAPRSIELDPAQSSVVGLPVDHSGVVVGAPGTGKTTTIVERVRRLVEQGVRPDDLLVLTASRQAASALRDALAVAVGVATAGPLARSVTAFAFQTVRVDAVRRGEEPPRLLTGGDEDALVRDLLAGDAEDERDGRPRWPAWLPAHVRDSRGFRAELRAFIAECTALGIDHRSLAERARREDRDAWRAAASFLADYDVVRDSMRAPHRDAAGLVDEAAAIVRASGAAGVRVLIVDDAQELTRGGVELLRACRDSGTAVLAFGDPDVGSGAFRGAAPENFALLADRVPLHVLDVPHRASGRQADLVSAVTARIGATGVVAHRRPPGGAVREAGDEVRALVVRSRSEEFDTVARLLRERHVLHGVAWESCAVIAHDSAQVAAFEAELAAREVPTLSSGAGAVLRDSAVVRDLLRLIDLASRPDAAWARDDVADVLAGAGLDAVEQRRLRTALRQADAGSQGVRTPEASDVVASALARPLEFALVDSREARRGRRAAETVAAVRGRIDEGATAHELLWAAWEGSGRQRELAETARGHGPLAAQADRDLDAVVALFQAAKRHGEREDGTTPVAFLRGILDSDVGDDRFTAPAANGAVRVLTPAAALGSEFDTVVVAGVQDGVWPNLRVRGSLLDTWRLAFDDPAAADALDRRRGVLHDELRLFARAVSRSRSRLIVTAVADDDTGPSPFFALLPDPEAAPPEAAHPLTLRGLVARHRRVLTDARATPPARAAAAGQLALLTDAGVAGAAPDEWFGVAGPTTSAPLRDRDTESIRVSPSRLETVEECQLNWVIGDLGGDAGSATAGIGTIVHGALEVARPDEESLWSAVESRWGELEFESPWRDRAERVRARDLVRRLARYLRDFDRDGGRLLAAEPRFEVELARDDTEARIVLSGAVDRVELRGDGSVVIVDLKTGKREPQTDRGVATHAQLAAYQLAHESGAIPAAAPYPGGGAMLLVLRPTAATKDYAAPRQPPFDDEAREAFVGRVHRAADAMAGASFSAPFEEHCRDDHSFGLCRIHTIAPVSAT
ncbi:MAG: ATP-dependent DNA helicase [Microbacterium arborescens]